MQEQNEKRSGTRHDSQRSLYAHVQVFSHQRLSFAGWLAEEEKGTFQTFVESSSPVAVCAKAVIALAALQQSKPLLAVPKSSAMLL